MSSNDSKDPAEQRREKLQALRERREQVGRRAPAEGAGAAPAGGAPGPGARRFGGAGGGGAGGAGGGGDRRAQIVEALKNNPEKRKELMERFPQLREAMEKRRQGGNRPGAAGGGAGPVAAGFAGGGRPGGGAARGPMAPQAPAQAKVSAPDASAALNEQIKALERRVAELGDGLKKTREELEEARRERVTPAVAAPAAAAAAAPAAAAPARPAAAAASASNTDSKRRSAAAKTKLASLKKASPKK